MDTVFVKSNIKGIARENKERALLLTSNQVLKHIATLFSPTSPHPIHKRQSLSIAKINLKTLCNPSETQHRKKKTCK